VVDARPVLGEMSRILKAGGRAVVVDLLPHDREDFRLKMGQQVLGLEMGRVKGMMEEVGMKVGRAVELGAEAEVKGPGLFLVAGGRDGNGFGN